MDYTEILSQSQSILAMELHDVKDIEPDKLEKIKFLLGISWTPEHMKYNKTNIVLTEIDEYEKLKETCKKIEEILKLDMIEFNLHCYIIRYVNSPELKAILGAV